jgi:hypothetical protein
VSIPQQIIEQVRERARIEDIVRNYVPSLKKKERTIWACARFIRKKLLHLRYRLKNRYTTASDATREAISSPLFQKWSG